MIKYKYLPFTHNKPRYQLTDQSKWQLKAQILSSKSDNATPSTVIISDDTADDTQPLIISTTATTINNISDIWLECSKNHTKLREKQLSNKADDVSKHWNWTLDALEQFTKKNQNKK